MSATPMNTATHDPTLKGDARRLEGALTELGRVLQFRDRDRICRYDVTVSQCYALRAAVRSGGLTVNDLSAELYLDKSTASRLANGLVEKGYLRRLQDPDDGRSFRLEPTAGGSQVYRAIEEEMQGEYEQILAGFDPAVRHGVAELVTLLTHSLTDRVDCSSGSCCVIPAVAVPG